MLTSLVAFLLALVTAVTLTLAVRNFAVRFGWLDQTDSSRKIHQRPVPRLGGIAIVLAFFAPLVGLFTVDSGVGHMFLDRPELVLALFGGGTAIATLGLYDDLKGAGALLKFSVQFSVAIVLFCMGFRVDVISNPFGSEIQLGLLAFPFTLLWIVGVVNAINLIDGLDGLAGGVAFFGISTNLILALTRSDWMMALMMSALAGAVLGFLVFNFNPASIFMGDTGSMFLGFVLATVSLRTSSKSGAAVAMVVPIIALGLPIMDTLLAMIRRTLLGRPVFSADKEHIHHRLMSRLVLSHRNAVLVMYSLCCLFALTALALAYATSAQSALLLGSVGIVVFVLMRKLGYLNLQQAAATTSIRRRNHQLRHMVQELNGSIRTAETLADIWAGVRPLADLMDLSKMTLRFEQHLAEGTEGTLFETSRPAGKAFPLEVQIPVQDRESQLGSMTFVWSDGRGEVNRDEELALELISDSVAKAASRVVLPAERERSKVISLRK